MLKQNQMVNGNIFQQRQLGDLDCLHRITLYKLNKLISNFKKFFSLHILSIDILSSEIVILNE